MAGILVILDHVTFIENDSFPCSREEKRRGKIYKKWNVLRIRLNAATHESYVVMTTRNPSAVFTRLVSSHTSLKRPLWKTHAERAPGKRCERISRRHYLTTNKQATPSIITTTDTRSTSRPSSLPRSPSALRRSPLASSRVLLSKSSDSKVIVFPKPISSATMPPFIE